MKQIAGFLALALLALVVGTLFVFSLAAENAIEAYSDIQAQPVSAAELALLSRQTPVVVDDGRRSIAGVAFLAVMLLAVGATVAVLFYGKGFLKEFRLLRKKPATPQQAQMPGLEYLPPTISGPVDPMYRAQRPMELPQWTQNDTHSHS